jgi:hypothetical protein
LLPHAGVHGARLDRARAANYHSRSAVENRKYRAKLVARAAAWARWLSARFGTQAVGGALLPLTKPEPEVQSRRQRSDLSDGDEDSELAALLEQLDDRDSIPQARPIASRSSLLPVGVQLPQHPGYKLVDSSRSWGTSTTIHALTAAFDEIVGAEPAAPRVEVHDLSLRFGGRMRGHKSHQTGRDVDITYYQRGSRGTCSGRRVRPDELDALREWRLLRHWLERGDAQFIFVDYALQLPLYDAAKASGATERELGEWFQYPRGPKVRAGIIRHAPNHANHLHVRFNSRTPKLSRADVRDDYSEIDLLEE